MKLPSRKRALRWLVMMLVVLLVGLYILMPIGFALFAVLPYQESVGAPPAGFEVVTLTTGDGVKLAAWYQPPDHGVVIILTHGAGNSRESVREYAAMLVRNGYGVLALDLRGHGSSEGTTNRLGWRGTDDIGAAVAYLQAREEVTRIGGLGLSMGAEVLLGAASTYPALEAIVADGATHRSLDELKSMPSERSLWRNFTARVMYAAVQVLSGDEPPEPPLLDSMVAAESTVFLLIVAGTNEKEEQYNRLFADTVGERVELWLAPGASHTGAFKKYPEEYAQRVIAFFDAVFNGE